MFDGACRPKENKNHRLKEVSPWKSLGQVRTNRNHVVELGTMGMTYFKRYRMEFDLRGWKPDCAVLPAGYELLGFTPTLTRDHAMAKYNSFRQELDADVFPCLSQRDGCLRLMQEIASRKDFVPESTWLIRHREMAVGETVQTRPIGTVQGLAQEGWGAIQNLGIDPAHRGKGLGSILLHQAAVGFQKVGLERMHLEVTTENTGAVRLYERLGFKRANVVYKATEIAGAQN